MRATSVSHDALRATTGPVTRSASRSSPNRLVCSFISVPLLSRPRASLPSVGYGAARSLGVAVRRSTAYRRGYRGSRGVRLRVTSRALFRGRRAAFGPYHRPARSSYLARLFESRSVMATPGGRVAEPRCLTAKAPPYAGGAESPL